MFTLFNRSVIRTVGRGLIPKASEITLKHFQSRKIDDPTYFKSHDEINAFIPKNRSIQKAMNKENISTSSLINYSISELKMWSFAPIQKAHHSGHISFQKFLSFSSYEKEKLSILFSHFWCLDALEEKLVSIEQLISHPMQDTVNYLNVVGHITGHPYWFEILKTEYTYPTSSITFDEFINLKPEIKNELHISSMNYWINEFTMDEFFALPKTDRKDLYELLFTTLGEAALIQKQITIKQFLTFSPQQRHALYDLFYSDDDHGTAKYQIPYNNRIFNNEKFDLNEFVNLPAPEREKIKVLLMFEEPGYTKNSFN